MHNFCHKDKGHFCRVRRSEIRKRIFVFPFLPKTSHDMRTTLSMDHVSLHLFPVRLVAAAASARPVGEPRHVEIFRRQAVVPQQVRIHEVVIALAQPFARVQGTGRAAQHAPAADRVPHRSRQRGPAEQGYDSLRQFCSPGSILRKE